MIDFFKDFDEKKKVLVILAHPDDPEFFLGGTIAQWIEKGSQVDYTLLTNGERGVSEAFPNSKELVYVRRYEQRTAADVLGVGEIEYFGYPDGFLTPSLEIRKKMTRHIRMKKPDIVVTSDPQNYFYSGSYLNHPDHRAAGEIVVQSIFPAVGNSSFYPELNHEGLPPHQVQELWISLSLNPNIKVDVSHLWQKRTEALLNHRSQIGTPETFIKHLKERKFNAGCGEDSYFEYFNRIIFRR